MRAVVQRVKQSRVLVDNKEVGAIKKGFNVLIGIGKEDTLEDAKYIKDKIIGLRVFEDSEGKMNLSIKDVSGELLIISQFTLYGDCRKGRRPNFMNALSGALAENLYEELLKLCKDEGIKVASGIFGAEMEVEIINDGPVTILIDSKRGF